MYLIKLYVNKNVKKFELLSDKQLEFCTVKDRNIDKF